MDVFRRSICLLTAGTVLLAMMSMAHASVPSNSAAQKESAKLERAKSRKDQTGASESTKEEVEEPTQAARAELAIFQTVHGSIFGIELCGLAECEAAEGVVLFSVLGGAGALTASLQLTENGIRSAQTQLINSGTFWGAANAGLLVSMTEPESAKGGLGILMLGQLAGLGVGAGIGRNESIHSGDVALANTGGIWGMAITSLLLQAQDDFSPDKMELQMFAGMNLGLLGGAFASQYTSMSRGRTYLMDAAGILGTGTGVLTHLMIYGEKYNSAENYSGMYLAGAAGAVAGLAAGTYFTRNWDEPQDESSSSGNLAVVPTKDGGAQLTYGLRF